MASKSKSKDEKDKEKSGHSPFWLVTLIFFFVVLAAFGHLLITRYPVTTGTALGEMMDLRSLEAVQTISDGLRETPLFGGGSERDKYPELFENNENSGDTSGETGSDAHSGSGASSNENDSSSVSGSNASSPTDTSSDTNANGSASDGGTSNDSQSGGSASGDSSLSQDYEREHRGIYFTEEDLENVGKSMDGTPGWLEKNRVEPSEE